MPEKRRCTARRSAAVRSATPGARDVRLQPVRAVRRSPDRGSRRSRSRRTGPSRRRRTRRRRSRGTSETVAQAAPAVAGRERPRRPRRRGRSRRRPSGRPGPCSPPTAGQPQELLMTSAPRSGRGFSPSWSVGARKNSKHSVYRAGVPTPRSMLRQPIRLRARRDADLVARAVVADRQARRRGAVAVVVAGRGGVRAARGCRRRASWIASCQL